MKITDKWLKKYRACQDGCEWFHQQKETDSLIVLNTLIEDKKLDWANWTLGRLLNKKQRIQYAIYAAEEVLELFETKYRDDKRPRLAIEAAKAVLKRDSKKNKFVARAAANASANAAAYAAHAAADAAAEAETEAAANVAYRSDGAAMKLKLIQYGISLLKTKLSEGGDSN